MFELETGAEPSTTSSTGTGNSKFLSFPAVKEKGVVGTFESWKVETGNDGKAFLELTFDIDGIKTNKRIYEKKADLAQDRVKQITDDLTLFAKTAQAVIPNTKVNSWKDFFETTLGTAQVGGNYRLKLAYKDKVRQIDFEKAQNLTAEQLHAKFPPFTIISKSDTWWFKPMDDTRDFPWDEQWDISKYEVMVKEQVLPSGVEDLPFATSTPAVVEDDMF